MWDTTAVASARISPRPTLPGAWYDAEAAEAACNFFPWYLRLSGGPRAGAPFHLEPWQRWIVGTAFGWKRPDGYRLYQRVILWIPRKNGKTELLAGISHIAMIALGAVSGDIYSIASTEDQANIVFRAAQTMAAMNPALASHYELLKKVMYCPGLGTKFQPLTAKPVGKHGLRTLFLIGDEAHEWKSGDLYYFVRQSMGMWPEPMEWIISTAGNPGGFGYDELWDECERILDGSLHLDDTLVVAFGAGDKDDIGDPAVWAKANPNLGVSINEKWFASEAAKAVARPSARIAFRRYHLNLWTADTAAQWLPADEWAHCTSTPLQRDRWRDLEAECAGRVCFGGLDLASTRDTNALVWVFPPDAEHPRWTFLYRVFWPRDAAEAQKDGSRIPIAAWEDAGAIIITPGNTSDHHEIRRQVHRDMERFQVQQLGIDEWNSHQIAQDLAADGVPIVKVPQRMAYLSAPAKMLERLVFDHQCEHGNQPVARWQAACAAIRTDDQENIMPTKRRSTGKIDTVAATVNGLALATAGHQVSYLASNPLIVLPI
jgi:phage terminase large subunit-like protein